MKKIIILSLLFLIRNISAVDIQGDYTVGLGGSPRSFEDTIEEGESKDGRSYINNVYTRDGFSGSAHFSSGDGVYPDVLVTSGSVMNGCTLTVSNWVDYSPQNQGTEITVAGGTQASYFIGQGTESENPLGLPVRSAFKGYFNSCRPSFSLNPDNVSSATIANPANYVSVSYSGVLTIDLSGLSLDDGELADITVNASATNGYGTGEGTINITIAPAVLSVYLSIDGTPANGGAGGVAEIDVDTASGGAKTVTWVGKSEDFAILDRTEEISFSAKSDGLIFMFNEFNGDIEKLTADFTTTFNELTGGDTESKTATVTGAFLVLNQVSVECFAEGSGSVAPGNTTIANGEEITLTAVELGANMIYWQIEEGTENYTVDVEGSSSEFHEIFTLSISPEFNTKVTAVFNSSREVTTDPLSPTDIPDLPLLESAASLSEMGEPMQGTFDSYRGELARRIPELQALASNESLPDEIIEVINEYINEAMEIINSGSNISSSTQAPLTTIPVTTEIPQEEDKEKSNPGLGLAGAGVLIYLNLKPELYKPYWSREKPTKTVPVRKY